MKPLSPGSLVSRAEIKDILGVSRQRVLQLTEGEDFPRPIDVLEDGRRPVWRRMDIENWKKARK
jgi:predicted DNA-binding transcriptional regulator AlpA